MFIRGILGVETKAHYISLCNPHSPIAKELHSAAPHPLSGYSDLEGRPVVRSSWTPHASLNPKPQP